MMRNRNNINTQGRENTSERLVKRLVPKDLEEILVWGELSGQNSRDAKRAYDKIRALYREMTRQNMRYITVVIMKNKNTRS